MKSEIPLSIRSLIKELSETLEAPETLEIKNFNSHRVNVNSDLLLNIEDLGRHSLFVQSRSLHRCSVIYSVVVITNQLLTLVCALDYLYVNITLRSLREICESSLEYTYGPWLSSGYESCENKQVLPQIST